MDFEEYRELASRTAGKHLFEQSLRYLIELGLDEKTANLLATRIGVREGIFVSALGLAGEAGETADYFKKVYGHNHSLDSIKLMKELGDVLWYVADLCTKLGISMEEVAQLNVQKLKERYPEGFDVQRSQARKPGDI